MDISQEKISAFSGLVLNGMEVAADRLNTLLESKISLMTPVIKIVEQAELKRELPHYVDHKLFAVQVKFAGGFGGNAKLIFSHNCATKLVHSLMGLDMGTDIDAMDNHIQETLCEVGNIIINAVIGTISCSTKIIFSLQRQLKFPFPLPLNNLI